MAITAGLDIADVRRRFSALDSDFTFFDGPGGTQTPDAVGDAIARSLREASANLGAPYATSRRAGAILEQAESGAAAFLGCAPAEISFGVNMTSLNFALSRTAARDWEAGDEVVVTDLDHDANVAPWLALADDFGLVVRIAPIRDDSTLDTDALRTLVTDRTRVVAFTAATNAVGTKTPLREVSDIAHSVGALSWIDATHFAAHEPIDVAACDADVLVCSTYKFCGPHLGLAYVREGVASTWRAYKSRPAATTPTGRMLSTGTPPFEALAGVNATFAYFDEIGGMPAVVEHERRLAEQFVRTRPAGVVNYGLPGVDGRVPTFMINVEGVPAPDASARLAEAGFGVWSGDTWYSLGLYRRLGFGAASLRVGISHYNTAEEVERLQAALATLAASA
jgi:cysteine desulfurase family protein (TIGR01976 family)